MSCKYLLAGHFIMLLENVLDCFFFLTIIAHLLVCHIRGHSIQLDSVHLHIPMKKEAANTVNLDIS